MEKRTNTRLAYLDGLRGLAALGVVFCHLVSVFWSALYFEDKAVTVFEQIWCGSPLNAITNGNLPVQFFFILSGLLITRKMYAHRPKNGAKILYRKYTNLLKLVIPAILLPFLLMRFGLMYHFQALELDGNLSFVSDFNHFSPTLKSLLFDVGNTFIGNSEYNGPLWTIHFELIGSLAITVIAFFVGSNVDGFWRKKLTYLLFYFHAGFLNLNYCAFVAGALTFDLYYDLFENTPTGSISRFRLRFKSSIKLVLLIVGLYFATINMQATGIWSPFHFLARFASQLRVWGICLCLLILLTTPRLQRLFSGKLLGKLGEMSRYIYIFHWPIILSLGCFAYFCLYHTADRAILLLTAAAVSITGTLVFSLFYSKLETALIRGAKKLLGKQQASF